MQNFWPFPTKENKLKVGFKEEKGFCIQVSKGRDHNTPVPINIVDMFHQVLEVAGVKKGNFSFQVTGISTVRFDNSKIGMLFADSINNNEVRVHVKSGRGDAVVGMFRIPVEYHIPSNLLPLLKQAAERIRGGKAIVVAKPEFQELPTTPQLHVVSVAPPDIERNPVMNESSSHPAEGSSSTHDVGRYDKDTLKLLVADMDHDADPNGLFLLTDVIIEKIYRTFPGLSRHGLSTGVMFKLVHFGLITKVGPKQYQISQLFYDEMMPGKKTISPLPILKRASNKAKEKKPKEKKNSSTPLGISGNSTSKKEPSSSPQIDWKSIRSLKQGLSELNMKRDSLSKELEKVDNEILEMKQNLGTIVEGLSKEDLLAAFLGE